MCTVPGNVGRYALMNDFGLLTIPKKQNNHEFKICKEIENGSVIEEGKERKLL